MFGNPRASATGRAMASSAGRGKGLDIGVTPRIPTDTLILGKVYMPDGLTLVARRR